MNKAQWLGWGLLVFCVGCGSARTAKPSDTLASVEEGDGAVKIASKKPSAGKFRPDITRSIEKIQSVYTPACPPTVKDVKSRGTEGDYVEERWLVDSCNAELEYPVKVPPDSADGSLYWVTVPEKSLVKITSRPAGSSGSK